MKVFITHDEMFKKGEGVHGVSQVLFEKGINPQKSFTSKKDEDGITFYQDDKLCLNQEGEKKNG